jgi:hypothetical protein
MPTKVISITTRSTCPAHSFLTTDSWLDGVYGIAMSVRPSVRHQFQCLPMLQMYQLFLEHLGGYWSTVAATDIMKQVFNRHPTLTIQIRFKGYRYFTFDFKTQGVITFKKFQSRSKCLQITSNETFTFSSVYNKSSNSSNEGEIFKC